MVVKKDNDLKKERKKKEKKEALREGMTSRTAQGDAKKGAEATAWASFVSATVHTIIFLWILFPFYSWQLQIIFDQARCQTPGDKGCPLPSNQDLPPYCPGPNVGHGCRETLNGPDSLNAILEFFTHTLAQIYEIITGMVWIKADEEIKKMEKHVANHKSQPKNVGKRGGGKHEAARKSFIPFRSATKHSSTYGQAVDIAEKVLGTTSKVDLKTLESAKCCGDVLQYENVEQHAKCKQVLVYLMLNLSNQYFLKTLGGRILIYLMLKKLTRMMENQFPVSFMIPDIIPGAAPMNQRQKDGSEHGLQKHNSDRGVQVEVCGV